MKMLVIFGVLLAGGESVFFAMIGAIIMTLIISAISKMSSSNREKELDKILMLTNQANEHFDNDNYIHAIEYYLKVLNISRCDIEALERIALSYHMMKDYDNSQKYIEIFHHNFDKLKYTSSIITYLHGHIHFMKGDLEQASNYKNRAVSTLSEREDWMSKRDLNILKKLNLY